MFSTVASCVLNMGEGLVDEEEKVSTNIEDFLEVLNQHNKVLGLLNEKSKGHNETVKHIGDMLNTINKKLQGLLILATEQEGRILELEKQIKEGWPLLQPYKMVEN